MAIKKITNVFDHVSDATRILREIKLLRLLRHPGELVVGGGAWWPPAVSFVGQDGVAQWWVLDCDQWSFLSHHFHTDIVEIKHIMLPPSPHDFKDIYVVFELMETDLHQVCGYWSEWERFLGIQLASTPRTGSAQRGSKSRNEVVYPLNCPQPAPHPPQVIKANDDLTPEHHQFFLYQMLRGLKYIHSGA